MTAQVTVLNYSGGKQSTCILWMVIRGDIKRPDPFIVINADPGMENEKTYRQNDIMRDACHRAGIQFVTVPGPNLVDDLLDAKNRTRIDNPPYWTAPRVVGAKRGQLMQKCTRFYKIEPMDRWLRKWIEKNLKYKAKSGRLPFGLVEKWIGFCRGEEVRIKPSRQKYVQFRYPLLEMGMGNAEISRYYHDNGLTQPPRSVCNACFANTSKHFKEMRRDRPADFAVAVAVDEAIRDMSSCGVDERVFVSKTLKALPVIADDEFEGEQLEMFSCDSGYCFT